MTTGLPNKRATLHDVARAAGVSYQTVSRVVNNSPNVSSKTRNRVLRIIRELDYRPNRAARSLITGRTQTLQAIAMGIGLYGPVNSILSTAKRLGYQVALSVLNEPFHEDELRELLDELTARMIDGFVFIMPELKVPSEELHAMCRGTPFVQISADPGPLTPSVIYDQRYGTQMALQHLLDLGHRRIAEITGPLNLSDARVRHETYLAMMAAKGLTPIYTEGSFTIEGGYEGAQRLLEGNEGLTALFCGNDTTALGALRALRERDLRVPEDISLVGFDDDTYAPYLTPPLTTVRQDFNALGQQSVEYLVALIDAPQTPIHQRIMYPQLIVRQSTARVAEHPYA